MAYALRTSEINQIYMASVNSVQATNLDLTNKYLSFQPHIHVADVTASNGIMVSELVCTNFTNTGAHTVSGDTLISGNCEVQATTESSSISTGCLICDGGIGIDKKLYLGGNAHLDGVVHITDSSQATNPDMNTGCLRLDGGLTVAKRFICEGYMYSNTDGISMAHFLSSNGTSTSCYCGVNCLTSYPSTAQVSLWQNSRNVSSNIAGFTFRGTSDL